MSTFSSTSSFSGATLEPSQSVKITQLTLVNADEEYSHTLQTNVKQIEFQTVNKNANLQYAFTATESGTNYITVPRSNREELKNLKFNSKTLYVQADIAGAIVEILELY